MPFGTVVRQGLLCVLVNPNLAWADGGGAAGGAAIGGMAVGRREAVGDGAGTAHIDRDAFAYGHFDTAGTTHVAGDGVGDEPLGMEVARAADLDVHRAGAVATERDLTGATDLCVDLVGRHGASCIGGSGDLKVDLGGGDVATERGGS